MSQPRARVVVVQGLEVGVIDYGRVVRRGRKVWIREFCMTLGDERFWCSTEIDNDVVVIGRKFGETLEEIRRREERPHLEALVEEYRSCLPAVN